METKLRRKCNDLSKFLSDEYEYDKLVLDKTMFLLIAIHDGKNFLLEPNEVKDNFCYISKRFESHSLNYDPQDIRFELSRKVYDF
jgi:hypothetical protein